jgi:integrase
VYETRAGGRSQSARGYRIDRDGDLGELVELLLAAQRNLLRGGPGLDWRRLHLAPGEQPPADCGPLQTWGEIRSLIKADIAPGGPKAKDRNPFSCFTDRGYFGRAFPDEAFARTEELERFCLHTPASLDAQARDRSQPLVPRKTNTSSFHGVVQMVNYLAKRGVSIATPELRAKLEGLKNSSGRVRTPAPRFIPSTAEVEAWLDQVQRENPLRGWVMAVIACYGLRAHEVWHIERLPGESSVEPTFLQISMFESNGEQATKTGHRFALPLPEAWLERYRLNDVVHSRAMLAELRRRYPIRTAEASDGSVQFWNNAALGRVVVHWLRHATKPAGEIKAKLLGWHHPRSLPGRPQPPPVQGRCKAYDLRHAWAIRARETTTWSTALKAQAMGHSEVIHARRYLVEQTAQQIERGMALQKALDEGQRPALPVAPAAPLPAVAIPLPELASPAAPAAGLPEEVTPELLNLARQLMALSARG